MTEIIVIVLIVVGLAALYGFLRLASWIADLVRDVISVDDTHRCNRTGDRTRDYLRGLRPDDGKTRRRIFVNAYKSKGATKIVDDNPSPVKQVMRGREINHHTVMFDEHGPPPGCEEYAEMTPEFIKAMKSGKMKVHVSNPRRHNVQPKKNPRARTRTKS